MTGRNSAATDRALRLVARGMTPSEAARKAGIAYPTIWRAMKRVRDRALAAAPHPTDTERN